MSLAEKMQELLEKKAKEKAEAEKSKAKKRESKEQEKEEIYVCPECGREYKTQRGLKGHMEREHGGIDEEEFEQKLLEVKKETLEEFENLKEEWLEQKKEIGKFKRRLLEIIMDKFRKLLSETLLHSPIETSDWLDRKSEAIENIIDNHIMMYERLISVVSEIPRLDVEVLTDYIIKKTFDKWKENGESLDPDGARLLKTAMRMMQKDTYEHIMVTKSGESLGGKDETISKEKLKELSDFQRFVYIFAKQYDYPWTRSTREANRVLEMVKDYLESVELDEKTLEIIKDMEMEKYSDLVQISAQGMFEELSGDLERLRDELAKEFEITKKEKQSRDDAS